MSLTDALFLDPHRDRRDVWIAARTDGIAGSGTLRDPHNGSTPERFDAVMRSVPPNARVHLAGGTFFTCGYSDEESADYGWQPKAGQNITGSGIEVTTLQLVGAGTANAHYFAIGHPVQIDGQFNPLDFLEVADLTIDCNLSGNGANLACGAVRLMGNHTRIRGVKAVNWGTKTSARTCHVLAVLVADSFLGELGRSIGVAMSDCGIEQCIAVLPGDSPADSTVIALHAGLRDVYPAPLITPTDCFGAVPFIRHCFVDCGAVAVDGVARPQFRALSIGACHGGVAEGNQVHNSWCGGPYQEKASTRGLMVRGNTYRNVVVGPYWNLGPSGQPRSLVSLGRDQSIVTAVHGQSGGDYHYLAVGDSIKINSADADEPTFKGVFRVSQVLDPAYHFEYPDARPTRDTYNQPTLEKVFGVENLLIEGNEIELADFTSLPPGIADPPTGIRVSGGCPVFPVTPEYVHGNLVIRGNTIRILEGRMDQAYLAQGIRVEGARGVAMRDNALALTQAHPLRNLRCAAARYSNNRTRAGILIRGYEPTSEKIYEELATEAEDALVLNLLMR
jgi:hypothetical protein